MVKPLPVTDCGCQECTCPEKIPTLQIDVSKLGKVNDDALVHAAEIIEHAGDLYDLVKAHVKILQRCREVRGLTTAESAFMARGIALLKVIGGAQ